MEKLICCNLNQLFHEKPPDQVIRNIAKRGVSTLHKKEFMQLLAYLLRIIYPVRFEELSKMNINVTKTEEHRYRAKVCALFSDISELHPEAPPLPKVLPSHLIHPIGDNITCLLWKLSMIALIVCLQKNHGIEVEKHPSGDNIPKSAGDHFARLAVENEEAVTNCEQEKEALAKIFLDENRDLQKTIDSIKQETEVLKGILECNVSDLNVDENLKSQLADLNVKPLFTDIEASMDERFEEVETILSKLELYPGLAENCRTLLEYHECQKISPVYLCGDQLRQTFPHLKSFQDDQLSLENVLKQSAEKLKLVLKELEGFKTLCEEQQVEIQLDNALSRLNSCIQEAAECKAQLERLAETYKDKYWAAMVPLLEKRQKGDVQEPFFELCRTVSELACLPVSNLKLSPPKGKMEYQGNKYKKDWFRRPDIPVTAPNYMYFFKKPKSSTAEKCDDVNVPASSGRGDLHDRLPFSTIKKQPYHPGLRVQERMFRSSLSLCSPSSLGNGNESFPDLEFPKSLEKEIRKVLAPSEANFPDAYTTTPPGYADASEESFCRLSQISLPWPNNMSGSSEDSDRLEC